MRKIILLLQAVSALVFFHIAWTVHAADYHFTDSDVLSLLLDVGGLAFCLIAYLLARIALNGERR